MEWSFYRLNEVANPMASFVATGAIESSCFFAQGCVKINALPAPMAAPATTSQT